VTLNYDTAPFLDANELKPGAFAAVTDLMIPWASPDPFATVVVDDLEQERGAERPMVPASRIATDLGGLVAGGPRFDPEKRAAFAFRGIALGDYAATALALTRAG
jgi:ornithine cyclodeaminase/alanine dehydrogenase